MKFLNKKEQIIDLQITSYGRRLLSMGRFRPEYYAFFDDDVLYDSQYAGFTEQQNSASTRIKEVPQLETQTNFYSAEKQVKEATAFHRLSAAEKERARAYGQEPMDITQAPYVQDDRVTIDTIPDREFDKIPLGNSAFNSSHVPAWSVNVIEGEISSSSETMSGLDLPIPQINMTASCLSFLISDSAVGENFHQFKNISKVLPLHNKFLNVIEKPLILEIDEANTMFEWENFDIQVFQVNQVEFSASQPIGQAICTGSSCGPKVNKEFLVPLFFRKDVGQIQNGILIDEEDIPIDTSPLFNTHAEYYFDILTDADISEDALCGKAINKADDLFSQRTLSCDEKEKQRSVNIDNLYTTTDDGTECD